LGFVLAFALPSQAACISLLWRQRAADRRSACRTAALTATLPAIGRRGGERERDRSSHRAHHDGKTQRKHRHLACLEKVVHHRTERCATMAGTNEQPVAWKRPCR